jgi:hypothetical protein
MFIDKIILKIENSYRFNKIKYSFLMYFLFGNSVTCNFCNWNGRRFYKREICPKCKSNGRRRFFGKIIENLEVVNVLHISPNQWEIDFIKRKNPLKYYTLDIIGGDGITLQHDLRLPIPLEEKFDLIIMWHVLNCINEDELVIENLVKTLNPKTGKLLALVPIYPSDNELTFQIENWPYEKNAQVYGHWSCVRACGLDYYQKFQKFGKYVVGNLLKDLFPSNELKQFGIKNNEFLIEISNRENAL